jgi:hypothetical protein
MVESIRVFNRFILKSLFIGAYLKRLSLKNGFLLRSRAEAARQALTVLKDRKIFELIFFFYVFSSFL